MPTIDVPQAELFSSLGRPYSELFLSNGLWTDKSLAAFRINKNAHYHLCKCKIRSRPENHLCALALRPRFCISSTLKALDLDLRSIFCLLLQSIVRNYTQAFSYRF